MLEEGDTVPKFTLNDSEGNKIKSTDFKGKKHIIYFYPKDFTPGCSTQADEFSAEYKKFQKEDIEINPSMIQPVKEIKSLGTYKVFLNLHSEVQSSINIKIAAQEENQ